MMFIDVDATHLRILRRFWGLILGLTTATPICFHHELRPFFFSATQHFHREFSNTPCIVLSMFIKLNRSWIRKREDSSSMFITFRLFRLFRLYTVYTVHSLLKWLELCVFCPLRPVQEVMLAAVQSSAASAATLRYASERIRRSANLATWLLSQWSPAFPAFPEEEWDLKDSKIASCSVKTSNGFCHFSPSDAWLKKPLHLFFDGLVDHILRKFVSAGEKDGQIAIATHFFTQSFGIRSHCWETPVTHQSLTSHFSACCAWLEGQRGPCSCWDQPWSSLLCRWKPSEQ